MFPESSHPVPWSPYKDGLCFEAPCGALHPVDKALEHTRLDLGATTLLMTMKTLLIMLKTLLAMMKTLEIVLKPLWMMEKPWMG